MASLLLNVFYKIFAMYETENYIQVWLDGYFDHDTKMSNQNVF